MVAVYRSARASPDLPAAAGQVIEFDRGGDRGPTRYSLHGGLHVTPTDQGWELYRVAGDPRSERRGPAQSPQPFRTRPHGSLDSRRHLSRRIS